MPVRRLLQFFLLIALVVALIYTIGAVMGTPSVVNTGEHQKL
jgi:hypothetical protein